MPAHRQPSHGEQVVLQDDDSGDRADPPLSQTGNEPSQVP
jgi:hypothetical protein